LASDRLEGAELQARLSQLEDQLRHLQLVHDVNIDLTSTLDLDRVLLKVLERAKNAVSSATASILMLEGDELVFTYSIGEKADRIKPYRVPLGVGISGIVGQTRRAAFTNDVQNDPRHYKMVDAGIGYRTESLMAAPLAVNDRLIGVISATNKPGGFAESDLELLSTIGAAAGIAIENARLYRLAVEQGRMERELQMARDVQASLMPKEMPQESGWQFAAMWKPAREVSGDYYDFIPIGDNRLAVVIADVSDKGMPAALFMSLARSALRANAVPFLAPRQSIAQANSVISADAHDGMFVTAFYAVIDLADGRTTFANGGHNPPLIYHAATDLFEELGRTGIALGLLGSTNFHERSIEMRAGDWMLLFTDGVTDAENPEGESFGEERLRRLLEAHCGSNAQRIVQALDDSICQFTSNAAQFDDITAVVVKREG
jgi:phosphoserine phosphatase RsbU/P